MRSIPALALLLGALVAVAANAAGAADGRNAAALSLLETAKQDLSAGRAEQAAATIERALRIDPANPTLWHYLSLARLKLGDSTQAQAMAAKSHSLTAREPPDRSIRQMADDLWSSARSIGRRNDDVATWTSRGALDTTRQRTRRQSAERNVAATRRYSLPEGCRMLRGELRSGQRTWIVRCDEI
jgi:tetratricopeptide (TPR) repeat protein